MTMIPNKNVATHRRAFRLRPRGLSDGCWEFQPAPCRRRWPIVPKGHRENSPAFQRRDSRHPSPSPEGTPEWPCGLVLQPSLRDSVSRHADPALKCRAILECSFGTIVAIGKPETFNIQHSTPNAQLTRVGRIVGCSMLNVEC